MSSDVLWAWAAGIVDGEGCIRLALKSNNGRPSYTPTIKVDMTHEATIDRLHTLWKKGGRYKGSGSKKPSFVIQVNGEDAVNIARKLHPHLFTKSRQAELIIEFWERCQHQGGWEKIITPEVAALRGAIYDELKELNS